MNIDEHKVNISQKAFVFNEDGKFLTLFRTETAPTRPNTWDLPGGVFEAGEDPEASIRREIAEEANIEVTDPKPLTLAGAFNSRGDYVVTVAWIAKAVTADITLSYEHNDYKWVTRDEFLELESAEKWQKIAREYLS